MKARITKHGSWGDTGIEFSSKGVVCSMGTFCLQIPPQILFLKTGDFEIPDEFMNKEIGLEKNENPVEWYLKKKKELGSAASEVGNPNNVFVIFMDAVAKFCNYDRRGEMRRREEEFESQG